MLLYRGLCHKFLVNILRFVVISYTIKLGLLPLLPSYGTVAGMKANGGTLIACGKEGFT